MKKVLSLVLAIAMVLSSMSFAFAATFEDVEDKAVAKAVDALSSLGVVNGYEDGTYKPENSVTRAEMVKLLVVALGHGDLAKDSKSAFSDAQGKWYDGYAAVAQALGITNGTGAGKFTGEAKIKYTEVITMIMRALGYNDRAVNSNRQNVYNATAYKTTAARLNILKGVTFSVDTANRGDVALMLYNALEVQVVVPDENGNPVGQWIIAPNVLQGVAGQARTLLDDVAIRKEVTIGTGHLFGDHIADLSGYVGEKVVAYTNKDGDILFVKHSVSDIVDEIVTKGKISATSTAAGSFTVKVSSKVSKDFDVTSAQAVDLIVNNVKSEVRGDALIPTLDNIMNRVHSIKVVDGAKLTVVVEDVTNTLLVNAEYVEGKTKFQGITLPTKDGKVNTNRILFAGAASSLEDIEVNDVVQACVAKDSNNIKFYVTRETVEGKVTEEVSAGEEYVIDETAYELNATAGTDRSLTLGSEGTFYLDKDGKIAFASAKSTTVTQYGIIKTNAYNNGVVATSFGKQSITKYPQVKMIGTDGKEKAYDVVIKTEYAADGITIATASATGFTVTAGASSVQIALATGTEVKTSTTAGTSEFLVKYSLNDDGQITKVENATLGGYDEAKKTDAKFLAGTNTTVLGRDNEGKYSVIDLSKFTDATVGYQVITNTANFSWDFVIITTGINATSDVKTLAVVKSVSNVLNSSDSVVQKVTAWVDGVEVSYITNANNVITKDNTVVALTFNSSGLLTGKLATMPATVLKADNVTASAISVDNSVMKVDAGTTTYYTLSKDVVVYKQPSSAAGTVSVGDLNDIRITNGTAKVALYDKDNDGVIDVIYMYK